MNTNKGFTLIELMVALTVFAVMVAVGLPQLNHLTNKNRMVSEINNITGSLALARSESVRRGLVVTICGSTDQLACNTTNWEAGWITFTDIDKDGTVDAGDGDTILKVGDALTAGNTLRLQNSDNAGFLQFKPDGSLRNNSGSTDGIDEGTFVLCEKTKTQADAKAVNVNRIGRTGRADDHGTSSSDTTLDGIVDDVNGDSVTCPA